MNKAFLDVLLKPCLLDVSILRYFLGSIRCFNCLGLLLPLWLIGCGQYREHDRQSELSETVSANHFVDYQYTACHLLWSIEERRVMMNPLYWLKAMHCAEGLNDAQRRQQVQAITGTDWYHVVQQAILMGNAELTIAERQQLLEKIDDYRVFYPLSISPLLQLWGGEQRLMIALQAEKERYQRLQSRSDAQLKALRENQSRMQSLLNETVRKLENLTDIERQLSSRKQISREIPENALKEGPSGGDNTDAQAESSHVSSSDTTPR